MPTGYTCGILDGKITTFEQFAKQCMRAFGATVHMRDDDLGVEYTPRTPSAYHLGMVEKAKQLLVDAENLSDEMIVASKKNELEASKKYHIESIEKTKSNYKVLTNILDYVRAWNPPTAEHLDIKDFMTKQISETIKYDCNWSYHADKLSKIESELSTLSAKEIRQEMIVKAKKDLLYHSNEYDLDVQRCEQSNRWVSDFLSSL